ncbi:MAG: hypothetical protein FWC26_01170 [Fibromonadales bacterium]|nr:hypothetical protein [Fibromonadales bacterium]
MKGAFAEESLYPASSRARKGKSTLPLILAWLTGQKIRENGTETQHVQKAIASRTSIVFVMTNTKCLLTASNAKWIPFGKLRDFVPKTLLATGQIKIYRHSR